MYRLTQSENTVQRLSDNAFIPFDGGNRDYQEYLEWLSEGNTPEPYVPPPPPPVTQVTAYQAKIQLSRSGLYDSVQNLINNTTNQELIIAWEYATTFDRYSLFIMGVAPELGLTEEQIDNLFLEASKIT